MGRKKKKKDQNERQIEYKFVMSDVDRNDIELLMAVGLIAHQVTKGDLNEEVLENIVKDAKKRLNNKHINDILI